MPYSLKIVVLDFGGGVSNCQASAGWSWTEVGGPQAVERFQDAASDTIPANAIANFTFSTPRDLTPPPNPVWSTAFSLQESSRIARGDGWLFRSGRFADLPTDDLEVITAPETFFGDAEVTSSLPMLPLTTGSTASGLTTVATIITTVTAAGAIDIVATGTDSRLPAGVTFTFTGTMNLVANGSVNETDLPLLVTLTGGNIVFTAGPGTGFVTAILNAVSGIIEANAIPTIRRTLATTINAGVLDQVAQRVGRAPGQGLPQGVILSIRLIRGTTRVNAAGATEAVIGVRAALGGFGGVANKLPPPPPNNDPVRPCFIATAAFDADHQTVRELRRYRDEVLGTVTAGPALIAVYNRVSPPIARTIARSTALRRVARSLVVMPALRFARWHRSKHDNFYRRR
jgi:hypothetical protein